MFKNRQSCHCNRWTKRHLTSILNPTSFVNVLISKNCNVKHWQHLFVSFLSFLLSWLSACFTGCPYRQRPCTGRWGWSAGTVRHLSGAPPAPGGSAWPGCPPSRLCSRCNPGHRCEGAPLSAGWEEEVTERGKMKWRNGRWTIVRQKEREGGRGTEGKHGIS